MLGSKASITPFDNSRGAVIGTRALIIAIAAVLVVLFAAPTSANAAFNIPSYTNVPSTTAAGANAQLNTDFARSGSDNEDLKTAAYHLPSGSTYTVASTPRCTETQFAWNWCPNNSQVAVSTLRVYQNGWFGSKSYSNITGEAFALSNGQIGVKYSKPF
ncbi:MAG: hypothetical protein ACPHCI_06375, partial [Solirubrobacterales bacterium]